MENRELFYQIFLENKDMCVDLFAKQNLKGKLVDAPEKGSRTFMNYYGLVQAVLKAYKPEVKRQGKSYFLCACDASELTPEEQEDVKEMIEAIIDTIHYAKYKRSKK